jgi:hypothetical protein
MRIQILPLPPVTLGDATHTPFIVVIDQVADDIPMVEVDHLRRLIEAWGARGLFVAGHESIEISPALDLPDELQQQLLDHLNRPEPEPEPEENP